MLLAGPASLLVLLAGYLVSPRLVYDRFIWKYFWGPVVADASGLSTVTHNGVAAHPGYTLVSELGYGLLLIYFVLLLVRTLKRFDVGEERNFIIYFVPFIVGGGILRVLEDAATVPHPWNYFLVSPVIYFTVFGLALASLVTGLYLERENLFESRWFVAGAGTVFAISATAMLPADSLRLWFPAFSITFAVALVFSAHLGAEYVRDFLPRMANISSLEGRTVLFGHLLDGTATALSIDMLGYGEKHPVVEWFMGAVGNPYAFVFLKLAVVGGILYYMDEELRDDDPLLYNLVLLGILAVGLGPGTRNMVRAFIGV